MKKYFAKYIPVEGEIKHGDRYLSALHPDGAEPGVYSKNHDYGPFNPSRGNGCNKVQLFLCSRDIQVGDKYICDAFSDSEQVHREGYPLHTDAYKVIGEISPEATWVKEEDEFDEAQIEIVEYIIAERAGNTCTNEFYTNYLLPKKNIADHSDWWVDGEIKEAKTLVKVKGSCGHFH
jgi:hypothetical protein